jgi:hypothetical protein
MVTNQELFNLLYRYGIDAVTADRLVDLLFPVFDESRRIVDQLIPVPVPLWEVLAQAHKIKQALAAFEEIL